MRIHLMALATVGVVVLCLALICVGLGLIIAFAPWLIVLFAVVVPFTAMMWVVYRMAYDTFKEWELQDRALKP